MSEPRDPFAEFHDAVVELGRALRDALHLEQIVGWLNRKLTRT
jgi:hypothetical protein